jgi:hypothetical protein
MDVDPKLQINLLDSAPSRNMAASTHVEHWKLGQDGTKFLFKRVLGEFDLAHVKVPYSTDFEVFVNDLSVRLMSTSKLKK